MPRKYNIITTSAIISLMLFNVSTVRATSDVDNATVPVTTEVQDDFLNEIELDTDSLLYNATGRDDLNIEKELEIIKNELNADQNETLRLLFENNYEIIHEALGKHQDGEFELASELYNKLLMKSELSNNEQNLLELFIKS